VQVLRDHRKRQAEERLRVGPEWRGTDDYVFATAWGEPIHPDTVSSLMTVLINTHSDPQDGDEPDDPLPRARLHDLRHVHATTLLLAGVPVHVVAARLGHADPSITLRVYAHVISDQLTEAADIFARAISDTG
jgi:integrase